MFLSTSTHFSETLLQQAGITTDLCQCHTRPLIDFKYEINTTQLFTPTALVNRHRPKNILLSNFTRNAHAANHNLYATTTRAHSAAEEDQR
jgi:hypothetical protein